MRLVLLQMLLYQMQRKDGITNCYKETGTFFKHVLFIYVDLRGIIVRPAVQILTF